MELIISFLLAFFMSAFVQISDDLEATLSNKPYWAHKPTLRGVFIAGATWFIRRIYLYGHSVKAITKEVLIVIFTLLELTAYYWLLIKISKYFFSYFIFQIIFVFILSIITPYIFLPITGVINSLIFGPLSNAISNVIDRLFFTKRRKNK